MSRLQDMKITVEVMQHGRLTIPKTMRKLFDIQDGDFISFLIIEKQRKFAGGRDVQDTEYVFVEKDEWLKNVREKKE